MSHDIRCHDKMALCNLHRSHHKKSRKNHIFQNGDLDLWPMTLTFELIQDIVKVNACTKFVNREAADRRTHTHTDRQDRFYTLDRWRGELGSTKPNLGSHYLDCQGSPLPPSGFKACLIFQPIDHVDRTVFICNAVYHWRIFLPAWYQCNKEQRIYSRIAIGNSLQKNSKPMWRLSKSLV